MEDGSFGAKIFTLVVGLSGIQAYGAVLIVLIACGLGFPIPEDVTLFAAGFLAFKGRISLAGAIIIGYIGVMAGDSFMYWIGRIFGRKVADWPLFRRLFTPARLKQAERKVQMNARIICFTARFFPGFRAPIFLSAGMLHVPYPLFFLMDSLAALISVPVWVYLAYFLGDKIERLFLMAQRAESVLTVIAVLFISYFVFRYWKRRQYGNN